MRAEGLVSSACQSRCKTILMVILAVLAISALVPSLRRSPGQGGDDRGFSTKGVIAGHDHQKTDSTISCCGVPALDFADGFRLAAPGPIQSSGDTVRTHILQLTRNATDVAARTMTTVHTATLIHTSSTVIALRLCNIVGLGIRRTKDLKRR
jgi:hypothetical protein